MSFEVPMLNSWASNILQHTIDDVIPIRIRLTYLIICIISNNSIHLFYRTNKHFIVSDKEKSPEMYKNM